MGAYIVRRLLLMLADAVRHVGPDLRHAAAGAGQHRRHPLRFRRLRQPGAEGEDRAAELGLDQPIAVQYVNWIGGLLRGDLGYSYVSEKPALEEILPRIPVTAKLAGAGAVFSMLFGVPLGVISAVRQNTRARLRAARDQPERPVAAVVLARAAHPDGVRALVRLDPDLHEHAREPLAGAGAAQHPGRRGRLPQLRADHAADALVHAGGAAPGLHPHRARQGRVRDRGQLRPRAAQRACCRSSPSSASRPRS